MKTIFTKATIYDLDMIVNTCQNIVKFMQENVGIDQWDSSYPNKNTFKKDIENNQLYILKNQKHIIGFICINKQIYKEYNQVSWQEEENFKTIHRVGINPKYHGLGFGQVLYKKAQEKVKEKGIGFIRVDTYSKNIPMNNLIQKMGYEFRGQMNYKPNKAPWNCYEKKI